MKCVILAGGLGSRIAEETQRRPKPLVEVGGRPILWHIMKIYTHHGITDFVICLGYKGYLVKEYFANFFLHSSDVTFDIARNEATYHDTRTEPWRVTLVDTGENTMTGGRLQRVKDYLDDGPFCMTYGDGVGDIDITSEIAFHKREGRPATMTLVYPSARFGEAQYDDSRVVSFREKPQSSGGRINGGFFVLEPSVLDLIEDATTRWEDAPLRDLAESGNLSAWRHDGFWQPMDTLREREQLERLWASGAAPWKIWS